MGKERLANLALLHIHYEQKIDADRVVDTFAHLHPRRFGIGVINCTRIIISVLVCFVTLFSIKLLIYHCT